MFELASGRVAPLIFGMLLFVRFIDVRRMLLGQEISYSKLSKTVPLIIISITVLEE